MASSTSQASIPQNNHDTTPPSSFADHPLTPPPPTDEKRFTQVQPVLALFKAIQNGQHARQGSWREFQLEEGEYEEIELRLKEDNELFGYTKDKIR
jgi:hypothetical protein